MLSIDIIANAALGTAMSGGDRIFIENARRWAMKYPVRVFVSEEGYEMCQRNRLANVELVVWPAARYKRLSFPIFYLARTLKGCLAALRLNLDRSEAKVVYSASDFWPDSLPALLIKMRFRERVKWVAGFYLFAPLPNPFNNRSPYRGKNFLKGLLYYFSQRPIYWLVKRHADMVFVTSEPDVSRFVTDKRGRDRIVVILGGVDTKTPAEVPEPKQKEYEAVFIGRFHPQKGVLELIDIWRHVCEKNKDAKLAMIGIGELEKEVKEKISRLGLANNIDLPGFKDGVEKIEILKSSRVVVHPATYDSGGMAACEAMACGIPGVSFDLEALRTYYPKGMLKTPCYDIRVFAENILRLLEDEELYRRTQQDAIVWAHEWDWDGRAKVILEKITGLFNG